MNIKEFFQLSQGKWFSQRTTYDLVDGQGESSKSDIIIELLELGDAQVINMCEQCQVSPQLAWGGVKISWDTSVDWGKPKHQGSQLLVPLEEEDNPQTAKVLSMAGQGKGKPIVGSGIMAADDTLTLSLQQEDIYVEERIWFVSENLRLRTSLVKNEQGVQRTSFYSEIRRIEVKSES